MDVRIEKLVYGGDGLARTESKVIMTPFVAPGELVEVKVLKEHPSRIEAQTSRIIEASTHRIDARCPVFMQCGGCHFQHLDYPAQLAAKQAILVESLERIGGIKLESPPELISGEPWQYRNRAQLHFDGGRIGFHAAGSNRLVEIQVCPISSPQLNQAIAALRQMRREPRFPKFLHAVELFTNEQVVQMNVLAAAKPLAKAFFAWAAERIPGADRPALDYSVGTESFRVSHQSFFQVNRFLVEPLVEAALRDAEGFHALDLYAGVGLFTLPLTRRFSRKVTAVEVVKSAASDLTHNLERAGREAAVIQQSVESFLRGYQERPDFCLADPPRAGLGKDAVKELARIHPRRLTIVSCDPTTLARDLKGLLAAGYRILDVTLVDLFPQTYHLESVVRLEFTP